jgi:RHS repeat-associated protein
MHADRRLTAMPSLAHIKHRPHAGAGVPWRKRAPKADGRGYMYGSYVDELLATQTSASNNDISGYTLCANEWDSFALPSTCDVAYGAKGAFVFRSAQSGTIAFNNATFGDPAPGAPKKGYYRLSGGQRFYAHANHLYSVAALTDNSGAVIERYSYDAYGARKILAPDGITARVVSSYNQQIGFTGRFFDRESGLYYFRSRYYLPSLGRFIGRDSWVKDPMKPAARDGYHEGNSLYNAYFSPNSSDPSGKMSVSDCASAMKAALEDPQIKKLERALLDDASCGVVISCADCACSSRGEYNSARDGRKQLKSGGITLCANNLSAGEMREVLIHEYIHAYDNCQGKLKSCDDHACSEIRAYANDGGCEGPNFRVGNSKISCVMTMAVSSLIAGGKCKDPHGLVQKLIGKCLDSKIGPLQ